MSRKNSRTPTREQRRALIRRLQKRGKDQKEAQKAQEAQNATGERYEKLKNDYVSLETAYVSLQADYETSIKMYESLRKKYQVLQDNYEELEGTCQILLKSKKARSIDMKKQLVTLEERNRQIQSTKEEVAELVVRNNDLLQNVTELTVLNDALILEVTQRSIPDLMPDTPSCPDDTGPKTSWAARDKERKKRMQKRQNSPTKTLHF